MVGKYLIRYILPVRDGFKVFLSDIFWKAQLLTLFNSR